MIPAHNTGLGPGQARSSNRAPQDLPDGGSGDLYPGHQQLAVHPAVPSAGIFADQPQHQDADRAHGARPARAPGRGPPGVPACDQIAVPAEHGIRAHHQVQSLMSTSLGSRCSSAASKARSPGANRDPVRTELPLQDRELVAQREDLRVFVPAAHRQQPQQREYVRHTEIGESQQHGRSPCHSVPRSHERPTGRHRAQHRPHPCIDPHQHG